MCLQDVNIFDEKTSRCLFDNRSESILIMECFAMETSFPYKDINYTLTSVGRKSITNRARPNKKIYTL